VLYDAIAGSGGFYNSPVDPGEPPPLLMRLLLLCAGVSTAAPGQDPSISLPGRHALHTHPPPTLLNTSLPYHHPPPCPPPLRACVPAVQLPAP
jgi:hypothetical protein